MRRDQGTVDSDLSELDKHVRRLMTLAYIGAAIAVIVVALYFTSFSGGLSGQRDAWGQFGDYVEGVLNPTFAFLALIALLATLGMQARELRMSVKELANSADALAKQNDMLRKQTFEGTFFQTLRLHNEIVATMEFQSLSLNGRATLEYHLRELEGRLINEDATDDLDAFNLHYELFYVEREAVLGHYFRMLYDLVKFVHSTDEVDKRFYTNMLRAQLSSAEVKLLFYNCLSEWGQGKFKPLVEEYALLKTIPNNTVPSDALLHQYTTAAFGGAYPESRL